MISVVPDRTLRLRRGALALMLALLAGGCATPASGPIPPVTPVQRVGIVSLIGDRVQWSYFGQSSLDNRAASVTAADWGLDAAAARAAARGLAPGMAAVTLTPTPRLRGAVNQPLDLAAALQAQRAPLADALVGMFDEYLPPAVKQLGLQ